MLQFLIPLLVLWLSAGVYSLISTVRWLARHSGHPHRNSVLTTAGAGIPGLAVLLKYGGRILWDWFYETPHVPVHDFQSMSTSCMWWVLGPLLLFVGLIGTHKQNWPPGTMSVHIGHITLWVTSSLLTLTSLQ
jgi:hypothetical protein